MTKNDKLIKSISHYSTQIGGFAAQQGNLIASCDGVGTKILLAQLAKKAFKRPLTTIGVDCVAMVVNDLLCKGCKPLFFLDYFCSANVDEEDFGEVLEGIYVGCKQAGIELIGGETAELPGIIETGAFDVCGFGVGRITDKLPRPDTMKAGDKIVGLPSSGFHSNGYTLIRKQLRGIIDKDFVDKLLEPTIIYKNEIDALKKEGIEIKGLAHITGGGFDNVNRVLPDHLYADIRLYNPALNAQSEYRFFRHEKLFKWVQQEAELTKKEMMETFNCGVGMVVIIPEDSDWKYLSHILKDHLIIGKLEEK
tara:strand:- start:598 stop:1521 length:924 start_codon:yes stop_codon:yes gene_type:complete